MSVCSWPNAKNHTHHQRKVTEYSQNCKCDNCSCSPALCFLTRHIVPLSFLSFFVWVSEKLRQKCLNAGSAGRGATQQYTGLSTQEIHRHILGKVLYLVSVKFTTKCRSVQLNTGAGILRHNV